MKAITSNRSNAKRFGRSNRVKMMTKSENDQIDEWIQIRKRAGRKIKEWLEIRKEAGRKIDPETAEVMWCYGEDSDPAGRPACAGLEIPKELYGVCRSYSARSPGSYIWVCFDDLPSATKAALWEKHKASLAFPAGLYTKPSNKPKSK
jgi:hypothetical protein